MSSESYVITEDSNGAIVVTLDQVVINSIPAGIATTLTDLIPQRTFTHIESARYFTCDNGTEHGYYLTETNQYVGPHISGVRLPLTHATTQAHVQARNDSLSWIVPVTGERSVITFYDSDPGAQSTGTQNPAITSSMIVSPNGWQVNQTEDSYGSTNYQVSALQTSGGYDSNTADGLFLPARTPNVHVWQNLVLSGVSGSIVLYTPPPGMSIRLFQAEWGLAGGGPASQSWLIWGTASSDITRVTQTINAADNIYNNNYISRIRTWPRNGVIFPVNYYLKLGFIVANSGCLLDFVAELYVGP